MLLPRDHVGHSSGPWEKSLQVSSPVTPGTQSPEQGKRPARLTPRGLLAPGRRGKSSVQFMRGRCRDVAMETGGAELWILSERPSAFLLPQSTCPSAEASTWLHRVPGQWWHLPAVRGPLGGTERVCLCSLLGRHIGRLCGGRGYTPR